MTCWCTPSRVCGGREKPDTASRMGSSSPGVVSIVSFRTDTTSCEHGDTAAEVRPRHTTQPYKAGAVSLKRRATCGVHTAQSTSLEWRCTCICKLFGPAGAHLVEAVVHQLGQQRHNVPLNVLGANLWGPQSKAKPYGVMRIHILLSAYSYELAVLFLRVHVWAYVCTELSWCVHSAICSTSRVGAH
jgi:hypothetical protein